MTSPLSRFLTEHTELTRRYFLGLGAVGAAALSTMPLKAETPRSPKLQEAIDQLETWLTLPDKFRDVSRGNPIPHTLPEETRQQVGLTRETWRLEVISDPDHPTRLRKPMSKADDTALNFAGLMKLAETKAVRFAKVMTCLNIGCPLGAGVWGGRAAAGSAVADAAERESAPRVLLRLSQRRSGADVPKFAAGRPRAGRPVRPAAGDSVLQAQRRMAVAASAAGRCGSSCRKPTDSSRSSG